MRIALVVIALLALSAPGDAASDWAGWNMMRDHLCPPKRPAQSDKIDPENLTPACYFDMNCRQAMRGNDAALAIADGAEMFVIAFAKDRAKACQSATPW
jgi:hypothetical protein